MVRNVAGQNIIRSNNVKCRSRSFFQGFYWLNTSTISPALQLNFFSKGKPTVKTIGGEERSAYKISSLFWRRGWFLEGLASAILFAKCSISKRIKTIHSGGLLKKDRMMLTYRLNQKLKYRKGMVTDIDVRAILKPSEFAAG